MNDNDTPIIKIFEPDPAQLEEPAEIALQHIRAKLLDDEVKKRLHRTLNEYSARALVIAPDYYLQRVADTGAQLLCYFLLPDGQWTAFTLMRLCNKVEQVLGAPYMLAYPFDRESEEHWNMCFRLRDPMDNPIRQIFDELDKRGN
jgi:hypothetical protein